MIEKPCSILGPMRKSKRLTENELRSVFRLLSDLREMRHDQPAMHRYLVDRLTQLLGASAGFVGDVAAWGDPDKMQIESLTISKQGASQIAQTMRILISRNNFWDDPTAVAAAANGKDVCADSFAGLGAQLDLKQFDLYQQAKSLARHKDHLVAWAKTGDGKGGANVVSLHRYGGMERFFSGREVALVRLLFEEMHWMYRTGRLTPPVPGTTELPVRLQEILRLLLAGRSPKQIALSLDISLHTVRDHIKRIYQKLGVAGRGELMSRFVRTSSTSGI